MSNLIDSMCLTWRHDFGLDKQVGAFFSNGMTEEEREYLRGQMRKLIERHGQQIAAEATPASTGAEPPQLYMPGLNGCSDGGCIINPPKGMHTNGGCNCEKTIRRGTGETGLNFVRTINLLRRELQKVSSQPPAQAEAVKAAYLEGWEMGWADTDHHPRVSMKFPPKGQAEADWAESEACKAIAQRTDGEA